MENCIAAFYVLITIAVSNVDPIVLFGPDAYETGEIKLNSKEIGRMQRYNGVKYSLVAMGNVIQSRQVTVQSCLRYCLTMRHASGFNIKVGQSCQCAYAVIEDGQGDRGLLTVDREYRHYSYKLNQEVERPISKEKSIKKNLFIEPNMN